MRCGVEGVECKSVVCVACHVLVILDVTDKIRKRTEDTDVALHLEYSKVSIFSGNVCVQLLFRLIQGHEAN